MSARGDAARRARWAAKDKQWNAAQLEAALDAWLTSLPAHLVQKLNDDMLAIFGKRYRSSSPLNATAEERDLVRAALEKIEEINLAYDAGHVEGDSQPGQEENSMSLEQAIQALTAAVEANTAAVKAGGGASAGGTTTTKKETKKEEVKKPTKTREELAAVMGKVKEAKTKEVAQALIKDVGKSDKLAGVAEELIDELFAAAEKKLAEEDEM